MEKELLNQILATLKTKTQQGEIKWKRGRDLSLRVNFPLSSIELRRDSTDEIGLYIFNSVGEIADQFAPGRLGRPEDALTELKRLFDIAEEMAVQKSRTIEDVLQNLGLPFTVTVPVRTITLTKVELKSNRLGKGEKLHITYHINSSQDVGPNEIWLGANFGAKPGPFFNTGEDKYVDLKRGSNIRERVLTVPQNTPIGEHVLRANIWWGQVGDSKKATQIGNQELKITII